MKAASAEGIPFQLGQPMEGGFFMGAYMLGAERRGLVVANKAEGELRDVRWHKRFDPVAGALSFVDGLANTVAMAAAGSELAQKILELRIGGVEGWHLPALDQLELIYRVAKPTAQANSLYARSGINLSALPPTWPYTEEAPGQTALDAFRKGGAEAFEEGWYWTSTQSAANGLYAWIQSFSYGDQDVDHKGYRDLARAVRSFPI
jgi:hypothetical protein